ncbi:MAG: hypothetical protein PVJ14_00795 [Chromatiales bacterium]|jgi:hypothetical protein
MKKLLSGALLLLGSCFAQAQAQAQTHVIQIGGGDELHSSQGQIEANVIWLDKLFSTRNNTLTNFFASGDSSEDDVVYLDPLAKPGKLTALKRVFGSALSDSTMQRHNRVPNARSTDKEQLTQSLSQLMQAVKPGDEILIIYNGHGGLNKDDTENNYLRLWRKGRMTVEEFDRILDQAPRQATIRFVFPQCFSGAFHNLIYQTPWSDDLAEQNRCGFFAHSAFNESEGCTLSINEKEYKDYSTYYFAAVAGQTRTHGPLASEPDLNGDGKLSYREAHRYVLYNSVSKDLSRASSEVFLERWQPWYLKWLPGEEDKNSFYWRAAEATARRDGIELEPSALHRQYRQKASQYKRLWQQNKALEKEIETHQKALQEDLTSRWPGLNKTAILSKPPVEIRELGAINAFLAENPEYRQLISDQGKHLVLKEKKLEAERKLAQIDKIVRFKKLARLEQQFADHASTTDKARYARLMACEDAPLN